MFNISHKLRKSIRQQADIITLPPPIKGVNARDALIGMDSDDALIVENLICRPYGLEIRPGYREFASGIGATTDPVDSLLSYLPVGEPSVLLAQPAGGTTFFTLLKSRNTPREITVGKLFASKAGTIYDITEGGVGGHPVVPVITGSYWTSINYQTPGGSFMCACPIEGGYWVYDGTDWRHVVAGDGTNWTISGIDPAKFEFVMLFKGRLWFIEKGSTRAWYLPPGQLFGVAAQWNFGVNFIRGGQLQVMAVFTQDAGVGIDDHFVAISSQGDVVVYKGFDPATAPDNWALVGTWYCGVLPNSNRVTDPYGGDVLILSVNGLQKLSGILKLGDVGDDRLFETDRVNSIVNAIVDRSRFYRNWQVKLLPALSMIVFSFPYQAFTRASMLVQDENTHGWSAIYDHPNEVFRTHDGVTFAGSQDGKVVYAFSDLLDATPPNGDLRLGKFILSAVTPAYSNFKVPGVQKNVKQIRIAMLGCTPPGLKITALVDYNFRQQTFQPSLPTSVTDSLWDIGNWDEALWQGRLRVLQEWFGISGNGFVVTPQIEILGYGGLIFTQYDWIFTKGGPL